MPYVPPGKDPTGNPFPPPPPPSTASVDRTVRCVDGRQVVDYAWLLEVQQELATLKEKSC